jgi:OOP family OmpA-OmpF porin
MFSLPPDGKANVMAKRFFNQWVVICVVWSAALALIAGCAGTPLKVAPIDKNGNPNDLVANLSKEIAEARTDQVDVLSPTWFKKAQSSCKDAREGLKRGDMLSGILENIARGRAELEQAEVVAARSRDQLAETIESRQAARAVNAQQFDGDYKDVEESFLNLTMALEDGDFKYARANRQAVSDQYRALELRAITLAAVGDVRQLLQKEADQGVPKIAPKSYAQAQQALERAEAYIGQNRYNQKMIRQKASAARFMAQRAVIIAQTGRKLEEMEPEDIALWMEAYLQKTGDQLQTPDHRNTSFDEQQKVNLAAIADLQKNRQTDQQALKTKAASIQTLSNRLAEVEGTSQQVLNDKERLAAEKRFNELFTKVQDYFGPQEAEVYKQASQLIIRLKGIRFPVGQAVIMPDSYPLLTKVQNAIRTFGQPDVIIEGHTDSTGSSKKNKALSKSRAQAVLEYLAANRTLPANKISAVGYGSSRPIASNLTAAGRAQNRRIDVVIHPQMKAMP